MDEIKTDVSEVTIEMAVDEINSTVTSKPDEPQQTPTPEQEETLKLSTSEAQPQNEELSTLTEKVIHTDPHEHIFDEATKKCVYCDEVKPNEIVVEKTNLETGENEETMRIKIKPEESIKKEANRPCTFCSDRTRIMQKINLYREYCEGKIDGKPHIPYLQELCGYDYLDMLTTTLWGWINNERHEAEHEELTNTIKKIMERQQLRLLQRTLGVHNPSGAIFQLKANHGMIETEKQILAGQSGEPIEYNVHIVPKNQKQIEQENE